MNYENQICTGCGQPMHEGEDIVVCPECATPQHRECYNKLHSCVNGYLHASGYVWQPENAAEPEPVSAPEAENTAGQGWICPICGQPNESGTMQCSRCSNPKPNTAQPPFGAFPPFAPPFTAAYNEEQKALIGGEMTGDVALFVRRRIHKFMPKFRSFSQDESKKFSWNWAAFFLTPYYFFYRRMAKVGFLFMGILLALSLCLSPLMEKYYADFTKMSYANVEAAYEAESESAPAKAESPTDKTAAPAASAADYTAEAPAVYSNEQLSEALAKGTAAMLRDPVAIAVLVGQLLCRIFSALTADKAYYKKVLHDMGVLHERCADENTFRAMLVRAGGVSVLSFICGVFSFEFAADLLISLADRLSL